MLTFVLAAEALIIVPGPVVVFVVSRGIAYGRRAALATVLGTTLGTLAQGVLVALGLGAVVASSEVVFTTIKLAGAAYLVWLGIGAWRDRGHLAAMVSGADPGVPRPVRVIVREGLLVGATNPKTTLFFMAVLPQFLPAHEAHPGWHLLLLAAVFCGVALLSDGTYALTSGQVRRWLARSPRRVRALGAASGTVMVGLGVGLALTGRET